MERYIFHVARRADWERALQTQYRPKSLKKEGFIHCSTQAQLAATLDRFFRGQDDLLLLWVDPERVRGSLRYDEVEGEEFPHIYGPLELHAVVRVVPLEARPDGSFPPPGELDAEPVSTEGGPGPTRNDEGRASGLAREIERAIERGFRVMKALGGASAARRPGPGRWSAKEIVGHLLDSAHHNHQRFVRAALEENLVFPGYDGDRWVSTQRYQDAPWPALAELWYTYNRHLAHVVRFLPETELERPRLRHSLNEIAFRPVPVTEPATLEYLIRDYLDHLEHHLRQLSSYGDEGAV